MEIIIGLSGFARSGKDEAANVLVNEFGFIRVAFADKLREVLYQLNPLIAPTADNYFVNAKKPTYLQEVIDLHGWDGYKETQYGKEIRRLLQRLGTEAGRQTLWDTIWIDSAFAGLPGDAKVVVTDARFFNEFEAVKERGGVIWRIEREGVGPANEHASEMEATAYTEFDHTIYNRGSLEEYQETVRQLAEFQGLRRVA